MSELNVLCEFCLPFVRSGGTMIAMKGVQCTDEIIRAEHAIQTLGGKVDRFVDYHIPGTDIQHRAVIIKKISSTPSEYPRRFAKIKKYPL